MSENTITIFKLNFDGSFDEIAYANIKDVFTIVNILAIYIQKQKKMYVWIGKNATQALKNHVARIRVLLKEEFPQFRIIRNITFDMRSEPYEFFDNLNITKEELYAQINYQEKKILPIVEKIEELKVKSEKFILSEDYSECIPILEKIIELARKIEDDATVIEQQKKISDLIQKYETKKFTTKIEEATQQAETEYNEFLKINDVFRAHKIVQAFIKKFETEYDLSLIPAAKNLISKEEKRWKTERARLSTDLSRLEKSFNSAIKKMDIEKAAGFLGDGMKLLSPLIEDKTQEKWKGFADVLQEAKLKIDLIEKYNHLVEESVQLKKEHLHEDLKSKIKMLIKEFQKVDLPEYRSKLDILQKEVEYAEEFYKKTLGSIGELEKKTAIDKENKNFNEVLKDCLSLIDFAKQIDLFETVDRYQIILEETEKEIEERKVFEEKQDKLKNNLSKLEKDLTTAFKAMKLVKAREILDKGKIVLQEIVDINIKTQWNDLEKKYLYTENKKVLMEKIDDFLIESVQLKINFQFEELKPKIENFLNQAQEMNISEYLKKLESFQTEINTSEESFNKKLTAIIALGEKIKIDQEKELLDQILKSCEELIGIAQSIKRKEFVEKYSKIREETIKKIEEKKIFEAKQEKLREELAKLENDLRISLGKMELDKASKILEKGETPLSELVNEEVKKKWNALEYKFVAAKQLINVIEDLSKKGMESLMMESIPESLGLFEQVISHLQEYIGGE